MPASNDTYTRQQGAKHTYDIEYTALRYRIFLGSKLLKDVQLDIHNTPALGEEATWGRAVSDIEFLRGMPEG
jgi:hypothetical protein